MYKDFEDYGWNASKHCHKIYAGQDKYKESNVVITTWQSIYKEPRKWFEKFDCVIGDEAHLFKSKSLTKIMTKCHNVKYRIGFTGTLDGIQTHQWILEGLFGPCEQLVKTKELMEGGYLTPLKVKCLLLKHEWSIFDTYHDEIDYLITHPKRNKLIKNLCLDASGNSLVLFNYVERHGEPLYELINNSTDRKVFFVHGGVDVEDREEVRRITETERDAIIIASYGTFSTGINIKKLHNIIFASPSKSRIRNLQSIGRVLRKSKDKHVATLYDIADDISRGEWKNFTYKHFEERVKIYMEEKFDYEVIKVRSKF
jgi:superfamily II DNA or RNA helicase